MLKSLNHTSLESLFQKRGGGAVFDRHKKSICSKGEVISTNKETVYMVVIFFLLRSGILLDLKTKHIVC